MPALQQYVSGEMTESLEKLGYDCTVLPNPRSRVRSVPDRAAGRGCRQAHRPDLRPWRRDPRPGGAVAAGPVAVEDRDRRRSHVRPRHGRQQGPAHDQHRSACLRAAGARQFGLQLDDPDRDRRGDGLARAGRFLQGQQGGAQGRRPDRLGRPAARPSPADHLRRHARHAQLQPQAHPARGRPPFRQLGRLALQPRHHPGACAGHHHRPARPDQSAGMAAQDLDQLGARRAGRRPCRCRARARPRSIRNGARSR